MRAKNMKKIGICLAMAAMLAAGCRQKTQIETTASEATTEAEAASLEISQEETSEASTEAEKKTVESSSTEAESEEKESISEETSEEESASEEVSEEETTSEEATIEETTSEETSEAETTEEVTEAIKSVQEIYQNVSSQVSMHSMVAMPDDFVTNYYGVDTTILDEYIFAMSEEATSAETVILMKTSDTSKIDGLTTALQMVIDEKKAEMQNYLPEQYEIVNKSSVKVSGSYVYLVISENADTITNIIEKEIQ